MLRALLIVVLALLTPHLPVFGEEPAAPTAPAVPAVPSCPSISEFFRSVTGEWIGVCKQSTDNDSAEDKYFRAVIKESSPGLFEAHFDYYRGDGKGSLVQIGSSNVSATINAAGATGRIVGDGEVMVDKKVRKQQHDLTETMTSTGTGVITSRGSGSLKVSGMPLGLGKLGKVKEDQSSWSLSNGTLTVRQSMNIVFRALFVSKSFKLDACYTAVRGTDVASLITKPTGAGPKTAP